LFSPFLSLSLSFSFVLPLPMMSSLDAAPSSGSSDDSLYPIAVLIDELRNEDVQVTPKKEEEKKRR
jgi:hypothetical protein